MLKTNYELNKIKTIFFYIPDLEAGGSEQQIIQLVKCCPAHYKATLVVNTTSGILKKKINQINIIDLNMKSTKYAFFKLLILINKYKPDILCTSHDHCNISAGFIKCISFHKPKLVIWQRNIASFHLNNEFIIKRIILFILYRLYKAADLILANSFSAKKDLYSKIKINKKIFVCRNWTAKKSVKQINLPYPFLLTIGRLEPVKNILFLIKCFALIKKQKKLKFIIIGKGSQKTKISNQIKALNLENKIEIKNPVANVLPYIKACKAFLFGSLSESCPNVLLESLCLSKPIVALNDNAGVKELLSSAKTGSLVNKYSELKFAEQIMTSLSKNIVTPSNMFYRKYSLAENSNLFYKTLSNLYIPEGV